jgi:transposase
MYVCLLKHDGAILLHRNMQATPAPFLKTIAPYRDDLVVAVECMFTWYWLADLGAQEGIAFVLGHALYMKAMHGGKAKNDKIDSQKIAVLLRGGMLPQAYVYPAQMRATRALLRRRTPLMRTRAALLAHVHTTNRQYNLPELGKKIAYKANRDGVAERFADPAVPKNLAVDLAFIPYDDQLLGDVELAILKAATHHDAHTLSLWQTVPGSGKVSVSYSSTKFTTLTAFRRCRLLSPLGAWASVPKNPPGNAWALQAQKGGTHTSSGPCPKRRRCACVPIQQGNALWPAERPNMGRGKP